MLPVLLVQLQEMLLNVIMLLMLQVVNQDLIQLMDHVLHVQLMLNPVQEEISFNVIQVST